MVSKVQWPWPLAHRGKETVAGLPAELGRVPTSVTRGSRATDLANPESELGSKAEPGIPSPFPPRRIFWVGENFHYSLLSRQISPEDLRLIDRRPYESNAQSIDTAR